MTDKEVMQMALDIIVSAIKAGDWVVDGACDPDWVLNALRAALAQPERAECDGGQCGIGGYCKQCPKTQPEPEPVAFMDCFGQVFNPDQNQCYIRWTMRDRLPMEKDEVLIPLYTTQLRSEWVGLTDEEIEQIVDHWNDPAMFIDAIEAKLKKNNGY